MKPLCWKASRVSLGACVRTADLRTCKHSSLLSYVAKELALRGHHLGRSGTQMQRRTGSQAVLPGPKRYCPIVRLSLFSSVWAITPILFSGFKSWNNQAYVSPFQAAETCDLVLERGMRQLREGTPRNLTLSPFYLVSSSLIFLPSKRAFSSFPLPPRLLYPRRGRGC